MDRLETRELVYFEAVGRELHFSRAAQSLGIGQPVLSRTVARLERRMGVTLLHRTSRRVDLTDAGAVFLEECRTLLHGLDSAVQRAQQAARPHRMILAVRPGTGSGLLAEIMRRHSAPAFDLLFTHDRASAVRDGSADAAVVCVGSDDLTGLPAIEVAQESPVALLGSTHPLAGRDRVVLADLRHEPAYRAHCPETGLDEIVDMVALGRLITVVGSSATARLAPDVTAVPVADLPDTTLAFCWAPRTRNEDLLSFVRALAAASATPGTAA